MQSLGDKCLYTFEVEGHTAHVEIDLDDLLVCGDNIDAEEHIKRMIAGHFEV